MKKKTIKISIIVLCFMVIIASSMDVCAIANLNNTTNDLENSINNEVSNNVENELRELILNDDKEKNIENRTNDVDTNVTTYNTSNILSKDGVYRLAIGADSNKTIEIAGSNISDGAKVDIWDYGNVPAQKFNIEYVDEGYYKITARHSGKSLTVKENNLQEGAEIVQSEFEGLDSQKWIIRDSRVNGLVISLLSNPLLSITVEGNIANGSKIILSKTEDNNNQMLYFFNETESERTVKDGVYRLAVGADSNKVIEVAGSSISDNAKVDIWNYGNVAAQKFDIEYVDEGYYKITARHTGKSLTAKEEILEEGAEIVQSTYEGLDSQKWIIRDSKVNGLVISLKSNPTLSITVEGNIANGSKMILSNTKNNNNQMFYFFTETEAERTVKDGVYRLAVGADSNKTIEVAGSNTNDDAKVDIWDYGNAEAQRFNIEYVNGYYKITARHTGKSLTVKDGRLQEGTEIVQSTYEGLDSQKWIIRDSKVNGLVISLKSNPLLSITVEGNIENGSKMILSNTQDNNSQMFYFFTETESERTVKDGVYRLAVGADSSKVIEVAGSNTNDDAKVDIWDYGNAEAQKFNIEYVNGYYKITARHTGKSLTVKENNLQEGAEIVQSTYEGLDSQKWIIRDSKVNGLVISLLSNPLLSITVEEKIENGSKMILAKTENNNNQMLYFFNITDKNIKEGLYGMSGLMYKGTGGHYLEYYQIGKGAKHLFLNFSIHGFEDSYNNDGSELTYMANEFWEYLKNNITDKLVNEWTIFIIPVSNPDGQYDGWSHNGPGRTTVYSWAPGNQGIDMNRCFPIGYEREYSERNYNGTEPLQAYEAQSLRDLILNNTGSQNIVIDVHGWLNETIGDDGIGRYYRNEFGISTHIGTYGAGYFIQWARTIPNTRSMLLELPKVNSHTEAINMNLSGKFINATMKILEDF